MQKKNKKRKRGGKKVGGVELAPCQGIPRKGKKNVPRDEETTKKKTKKGRGAEKKEALRNGAQSIEHFKTCEKGDSWMSSWDPMSGGMEGATDRKKKGGYGEIAQAACVSGLGRTGKKARDAASKKTPEDQQAPKKPARKKKKNAGA